MQRRILFIVNPNAGKKKSEVIIDLIHAELPSDLKYEVLIWKNKDEYTTNLDAESEFNISKVMSLKEFENMKLIKPGIILVT